MGRNSWRSSGVDMKDFNSEFIECLEKKEMSEKLGAMFIVIVNSALKSDAFDNNLPKSIIEEAHGFTLEHLVNRFYERKTPDSNHKLLSYYFATASNYLRTFRTRRLGENAPNDIYGKNITIPIKPLYARSGVKRARMVDYYEEQIKDESPELNKD